MKRARQALKDHAEENYKLLKDIIKQAAAAGDYETAAKTTVWLLEHTPEEEGERLVDVSIDKKTQPTADTGPKVPPVQIIGISLGGINERPKLPASEVEVIDVKPE